MIRGTVIKGEGLAKKMGYPTANIDVSVANTQLKPGVYAAFAILHSQSYLAALVIHEIDKVEVFFLDYVGADFYGEKISVEAVQKVSAIERFDSVEELKEKISSDVEMVRQYFVEKG
ncbi:MAG: riboflavin kinase [Candidatus Magasanikbacteria bacterium]|nr:riboflavin kinase [Candidatus Magasanikbacteria bacterium]